jgi:hypothetical protein
MILTTPTIYEVMFDLWEWAFPSSIITTYNDIFIQISILLTIIVIYGLILKPLWYLATILFKIGKKR